MSRALRHLNLRFNPFGALLDETWGALCDGRVDAIADQLDKPGVAIQLIGARGRGKTTHLLGIRSRRPEAHYARVDHGAAPHGGRFDDDLRAIHDVLYDAIQRMGEPGDVEV